MAKLFDRVGMTTATTGTGTITLGSAITDATNGDLVTFATAGVATGDLVNYLITDGNAWEIGTGVYTTTGTTLSRTLVKSSSGSLLTLSGSAKVYSAPTAEDIKPSTHVSRSDTNVYHSSVAATSTTTTVPGAGAIQALPFSPSRTLTYTKIGVKVTAAGTAGCLIRLGIYADANGQPGRLILDAGTVAGDAVAVKEAVISQSLAPGMYWLVSNYNDGGIIVTGVSTSVSIMGFTSALSAPTRGLTRTFAFAAFPSDESAQTYTLTSGPPLHWLRQ